MQRNKLILILIACLVFLTSVSVAAGVSDNETLLSINGESHSVDDFKKWWMFWNDDGRSLPETPDPYIDWLLLSQEAEAIGLSGAADFQHKTRVFLQSRTLLKLQFDEINSKLKIPEADIENRYKERYLPRWLVQRIEFKDKETASSASQELAEGLLELDKLLERDPDQGGPLSTKEIWARPNIIDPGWLAIFQKMNVGDVADLGDYELGPVVYYMKEQRGGDEEDLAQWQEGIKFELRREQEAVLTSKMIAKLRDKWQVVVDDERLAAIDLNAEIDTFTDAPVITTKKQNVSEKQFMTILRRVIASRPEMSHKAGNKDEANALKVEIANNIIVQSITNWEALDRHYEEKEPFKWEYEFNYRHRLTVALEERLFVPDAKVSEDEIKQHYDKYPERYTQPATVILFVLDETQVPIDQVWGEVAVGKNFNSILKEYFEENLSPSETTLTRLDPTISEVVEKLGNGETSRIFSVNGLRVIAHLVKRNKEKPIPLKNVEPVIRNLLVESKIQVMRKTYLDKLRSASKIVVQNPQWQSIRKELGGV